MSQLGSIFEPDDAALPRGRDLRADVTVPAWACGHPPGYSVQVAPDLPALGGYARRAGGDDGDTVHLHLPAGFPNGGTLRLRGQGEAHADGRAGDLLLTVHVDTSQSAPPPGALTWSPGQVLAGSPPAPAGLVLVIALVFAAGLAVVFLL